MSSKNTFPPKLFLRFFRWYCHPKMRDYIEGDLMEVYAMRAKILGKRKADIKFIIDVILLFRPGIIRPAEGYKKLNNYGMYKSYFKIGWRNLLKNKGYSLINIGGLALGMSVAMLIGLWIKAELSFNKDNEKYDQIAQVMQHKTYNGEIATNEAIPYPIGGELKDKFGGDFKFIVMSSWFSDHIISHDEEKFTISGGFMDFQAPHLLSLKILGGSADGLKEPGSILLSSSTANVLFGGEDPIGKALKIDNNLSVEVTGVYEDLPYNSRFSNLSFIAPWDLYISSAGWLTDSRDSPQWDRNSFQAFVQITDLADVQQVSEKIKMIKYNNVNEFEKTFEPIIFLHPMKDWHLRSNWINGIKTGGDIQYVWMFGIIGIFVLILACINFMNLSTAHSERRSREVGVRKSIGSHRGQLILQFFSESFLVVVLAFIFSLALSYLLLPYFNNLTDTRLSLPLADKLFWLISIGFMLLSGFFAGSYPAFYLSSFNPIQALKGTFKAVSSAKAYRRSLIVFQFTISISLIIGTLVVEKQIQYSKDRPLGYDKSGILMVEMNSPDQYGKYHALRNELKGRDAIEEMTESSSPLTDIWNSNGGFNWAGKDPSLQANFSMVWVSPQFGKTVGWEIIEGRDLSPNVTSDSRAIIINQAAVEFMDIEDPIGKTVTWNDRDYEIVGVAKDMLMRSPYKPVEQTIYLIDNEDYASWFLLKLNPHKSLSESLALVSKGYAKIIPSVPFEYKFAEEEYARKFKTEERVGKLTSVFATLAIIISCLGLFGMASFIAEQRTKEIGIRKVMGATILNIWKMLSKEFVILVVIACFISIPIAYYFSSDWLQRYEYHTTISSWVYFISGISAVTITLLTVSYQSIKAALMNPVKSLRSE